MTSFGQIVSKRASQSSKYGAQKWTPHAYQKKALKFLLEHAAAGLFLDPGLGKTSVTLAAFSFLKKKGLANKMLVIAPLRVCHQVWPAEAHDWKDFNHLKVVVLHGPHKEELLQEEADVYCINPEGLEWLVYGGRGNGRNGDTRRWRGFEFDTLVIDELTKFKHPKGVRFKALKSVLRTFSRRWGLTGTPAPNGLLDLFGQCFVLDEGNALGRYITHYKTMYFINPDKQGWKWVLQQGAAERIYDRIKPLALRMDAKDYLELPELVNVVREVRLPPKAQVLYDALEEDLIAKIDSGEIVASNSAAATTKLRQVCNGAVYVDDDIASRVKGKKRSVLTLHDAKLDALEELVDELQGEPLLVAYEFNHDLDRLRERFSGAPHIGAGVGTAKSKLLEEEWNAGNIPVLFGQPASVGHGLNMQKGNAAHVAWFSMFWDLELYIQFLRRVLRQGNKAKRVFNYQIIARNPEGKPCLMDDLVAHAQRGKGKTQDALNEALKSLRK